MGVQYIGHGSHRCIPRPRVFQNTKLYFYGCAILELLIAFVKVEYTEWSKKRLNFPSSDYREELNQTLTFGRYFSSDRDESTTFPALIQKFYIILLLIIYFIIGGKYRID